MEIPEQMCKKDLRKLRVWTQGAYEQCQLSQCTVSEHTEKETRQQSRFTVKWQLKWCLYDVHVYFITSTRSLGGIVICCVCWLVCLLIWQRK